MPPMIVRESCQNLVVKKLFFKSKCINLQWLGEIERNQSEQKYLVLKMFNSIETKNHK